MSPATHTGPAVEGGSAPSKSPPGDMARWIPFAAGAFLVAYFVYFAKDGLRGHFALDDLANIFYYHHRGNWSVLQALIEFPSTYLRPMGALFYLPIFHFA